MAIGLKKDERASKMEEYVGVKFKTRFLQRTAPRDHRIEELAKWCRLFHEHGLTPIVDGRSMGNLSFRVEAGRNEFIITASGLGPKDKLTEEFFVKVVDCDYEDKVVYAVGIMEPSSESMLHYRVYQLRSDVNAVFHGHDKLILARSKSIGAVETREWQPYGTMELVRSVEEVLDLHDFIVIRQHGFISLGRSMEEAGRLALEKRRVAERPV